MTETVRKGYFILHSSVLPPVIAGRYSLVSKVDGLPFPSRTETTHVHVSSPRFTMPTDQILSTFPPANGEGAFGNRLPQVVLKRRTLPWERNPLGGDHADEAHPWLALVVVAEGEGELSSATPVEQCVSADAHLDTTDRDVDQSVYLAVTETVLKRIFPCEEDLPMLTHVRRVDVNDTELAMGDDDGWLSVVMANRLPVMDQAAGKPVKYLACLVNLEGQIPKLPPPTPPQDTFHFELVQDWRTADLGPIGPDHVAMGTGLAVQPAAFHAGPGRRARRGAPRGSDRGAGGGQWQGVRRRDAEVRPRRGRRPGRRPEGDAVGDHRRRGQRRRPRPRRAAAGPRRDELGLADPDQHDRARAGAPVPGAGVLVLHHHRGLHLHDA